MKEYNNAQERIRTLYKGISRVNYFLITFIFLTLVYSFFTSMF